MLSEPKNTRIGRVFLYSFRHFVFRIYCQIFLAQMIFMVHEFEPVLSAFFHWNRRGCCSCPKSMQFMVV
jgi:hypothetical protein